MICKDCIYYTGNSCSMALVRFELTDYVVSRLTGEENDCEYYMSEDEEFRYSEMNIIDEAEMAKHILSGEYDK